MGVDVYWKSIFDMGINCIDSAIPLLWNIVSFTFYYLTSVNIMTFTL